jgi:hypothetical protein
LCSYLTGILVVVAGHDTHGKRKKQNRERDYLNQFKNLNTRLRFWEYSSDCLFFLTRPALLRMHDPGNADAGRI